MPGPTFIECDRIDLQTVEEEDIEFLQRGVNHPAVRHHIEAFRTPINGERYRELFESIDSDEDGVSLLAVPRDGAYAGELIGSVQLYPVNNARGFANLGVWFLPQTWGNGYATEASAHLINYGFQQMGYTGFRQRQTVQTRHRFHCASGSASSMRARAEIWDSSMANIST